MSRKPSLDNKKSLYPDGAMESGEDDSWQVSYLDIVTILLGFLIILLSISDFGSSNLTSVSELFKSSVEEAKFVTTPIEQIQEELETSLEDEIDDEELEIIRDLNDIRIRFSSDDLYRSGSAILQQTALPLFDRVLEAIQSNHYNDFEIDVEGHTDNTPISSAAYPSNWELSTARATNVVKYFRGMGIEASRLQASGYGESRPLKPNEDFNGNPVPENKALNRRVDIRLYYGKIPQKDSIKIALPVITESAGKCQYSTQIAGFQEFSNSLNVALAAKNETGYLYNITYNDNLYSVRTKPEKSLQEALKTYNNLNKIYSNSMLGLVHQCYDNEEAIPNSLAYQIQLASFIIEPSARDYADKISAKYGLKTMVIEESDGKFKVDVGPFDGLDNTQQKLKMLKTQGMPESIFIKQSPQEIQAYSFNFKIQLTSFSDEEKAQSFAQEIKKVLSLNLVIQQVGPSTFYLLTDQLPSWNQTVKVFRDLNNSRFDLSPVIYLQEF